MIVLLSPAKSLDYESPLLSKRSTKPRFIEDSAELISRLRKLSVGDVGSLMSISAKLAQLNHDRFATWEKEFTKENSRPAILAFTGDVYQGMELDHWDKADFDLAQKRIRILSGLYGVLRPLDLMQPYRLEMGTKFTNNKGKNLYEFWGNSLTKSLNADLKKSGSNYVVNLASNEYFSAVKKKDLNGELITPVFKDEKNGNFKIISFYAKKARGVMSSFLVRNRIDSLDGVRQFSEQGYQFCAEESTDSHPVFLRKEKNRIAA